MTREEQIVFNEIDTHRGRDKAISVPKLTEHINIYFNGDPLTEWHVRKIVRDLVNEHGLPIGSATGKPSGYYIITDADELREAIRNLKSRIYKLSIRASKLEIYGRKYFTKQLDLGI